jgi:hypothetical protein
MQLAHKHVHPQAGTVNLSLMDTNTPYVHNTSADSAVALTICLDGAAYDPVASSSTGARPVAATVQNDSACGDLIKLCVLPGGGGGGDMSMGAGGEGGGQ